MNGLIPSQHHCVICKQPVRIIGNCSFPLEKDKDKQLQNEGSGDKRVSFNCEKMGSKTLDEMVSCNERENWKGLGNEQPKKRAKYIEIFQNN